MQIFVAGGTGVLGRRAVRCLVDAGHSVTAVSRSETSDRQLSSAGARPARVDLFDADQVRRAVAGHDAIINLATRIPPARQAFRRRAWTQNDRIRTLASKNLTDAASAHGVSRFVQESITLPYVDCADAWIDESVAMSPTWNTASALEAEKRALSLARSGAHTVVLRFAVLYAADAESTQFMCGYAQKGYAPVIGKPGAYYTMVHADDAAHAVLAALHLPSGIYNVAEDDPLTRRDLLTVFAAASGRPQLKQLPGWLLRLVGGELAGLLMRSQRISNRTLRHASDWAPKFGNPRTGWRAVLDEIDAAGSEAAQDKTARRS